MPAPMARCPARSGEPGSSVDRIVCCVRLRMHVPCRGNFAPYGRCPASNRGRGEADLASCSLARSRAPGKVQTDAQVRGCGVIDQVCRLGLAQAHQCERCAPACATCAVAFIPDVQRAWGRPAHCPRQRRHYRVCGRVAFAALDGRLVRRSRRRLRRIVSANLVKPQSLLNYPTFSRELPGAGAVCRMPYPVCRVPFAACCVSRSQVPLEAGLRVSWNRWALLSVTVNARIVG